MAHVAHVRRWRPIGTRGAASGPPRRQRVAASAVVAAITLGLTGCLAFTPPALLEAPSTVANLVPLYALTRTSTPSGAQAATAHFYTTDPAEVSSFRQDGWHMDPLSTSDCASVVGYLWDQPVSWTDASDVTHATAPVYRFYNATTNGYVLQELTGDVTSRIDALAASGYAAEGVMGYASQDTASATGTPLTTFVQYGNPTTNETVVTSAATPPAGFTPAWVAAYSFPAPTIDMPYKVANPQLCPLTMLTRTVGGTTQQLATTSLAERTAKLAAGWSLDTRDVGAGADGIVGYLWSVRPPGAPSPLPIGATVGGTYEVDRFYNASSGSYYEETETDPTHRIPALAAAGFAFDATIGYSFPSPQPGTIPLTFSLNPGGQAYYWTNSATGGAWAAANGYTGSYGPGAQLLAGVSNPVPFYERYPATDSAGNPVASNKVMITIHGGAWRGGFAGPSNGETGPWDAVGLDVPGQMVDRFTHEGWTVYNIDYEGGGARSLAEVDTSFKALPVAETSGKTICPAGESAGGQLALMLAEREHAISCVVANAAPTDLRTESALFTDPTPNLVAIGFGPDSGTVWDDNSPVDHLDGFTAKVLLATADTDTTVPYSQATELAAAVTAAGGHAPVTLVHLASGGSACTVTFVHSCVSPAAYSAYVATESSFLAGA
jgi:hypothetical protein